jgi:hypothetical protein
VKIAIDAAAERLRLSARPSIGIVTEDMELSATPRALISTPRASFPKIEIYEFFFDSSSIDLLACEERMTA